MVPVKPRGNPNSVRLHLLDVLPEAIKGGQELNVPGAHVQRHIHYPAQAFFVALVPGSSGPRIAPLPRLMHGAQGNPSLPGKYALSALAMVGVDIRDIQLLALVKGIVSGNCHVIKEAEAGGLCLRSMVPRRTDNGNP